MITMGMFRSFLMITLCLGTACDVGSVLAHEGGADAGSGGGGGDGGGAATCPAVVSPETQTGHHTANGATGDAGATVITAHEGCLGQTGCHNAALDPTPGDIWTYGGEAFQDAAGTIPYAGAHIMLTAAGDPPMSVTMEVMANGFFYTNGTFPAPSATTPITVAICTPGSKTAMATSLAAVQAGTGTDGNCNGAACHGPGQAGAYIYLTP
jgi:hypothetical protein